MPPPLAEWRLLRAGARAGAWNMACDAAILAAVGAGEAPPTLRLYGWDPATLSIGANQPGLDPPAAAALEARGIHVVRRPTGGRSVFHGRSGEELTYSVVAPLGAGALAGSLTDAYRRIHEALAEGLRALGIAAELAPRGARPTAGCEVAGRPAAAIRPTSRLACFAVSVPYEITAGGKKLVGSAQRRSGGALLQHGSLPLAGEPWPRFLREIWPASLDETTVTTASAAAGRRLGYGEVAATLSEAFVRALNVSLLPGVLSPDERRMIAARPLDTFRQPVGYSRERRLAGSGRASPNGGAFDANPSRLADPLPLDRNLPGR